MLIWHWCLLLNYSVHWGVAPNLVCLLQWCFFVILSNCLFPLSIWWHCPPRMDQITTVWEAVPGGSGCDGRNAACPWEWIGCPIDCGMCWNAATKLIQAVEKSHFGVDTWFARCEEPWAQWTRPLPFLDFQKWSFHCEESLWCCLLCCTGWCMCHCWNGLPRQIACHCCCCCFLGAAAWCLFRWLKGEVSVFVSKRRSVCVCEHVEC